jgi:Fe-S-cluster containining protein
MADTDDQAPWYANGLDFACLRCGRCCAGPEEGYVWVTPAEIAAIAGHLGIPQLQMHQMYLRRVGAGFSLREQAGSHDCIFLGPDGDRACAIYPVRPTQCRTWPFWPVNLRTPDAWARAGRRCPGISHGAHVTLDEIQAKRDATAR